MSASLPGDDHIAVIVRLGGRGWLRLTELDAEQIAGVCDAEDARRIEVQLARYRAMMMRQLRRTAAEQAMQTALQAFRLG